MTITHSGKETKKEINIDTWEERTTRSWEKGIEVMITHNGRETKERPIETLKKRGLPEEGRRGSRIHQ